MALHHVSLHLAGWCQLVNVVQGNLFFYVVENGKSKFLDRTFKQWSVQLSKQISNRLLKCNFCNFKTDACIINFNKCKLLQ